MKAPAIVTLSPEALDLVGQEAGELIERVSPPLFWHELHAFGRKPLQRS